MGFWIALLSLNHQGSGFELFGRKQSTLTVLQNVQRKFFPGVPELRQRPKAKSKASKDPFLVQRADNICLQLEQVVGPAGSQKVPRINLTSKGIPPQLRLYKKKEGVCHLEERAAPTERG